MVEARTPGKGPVIGTAAAAVLALAALVVAPWEGRELQPYRDIVGVWTVCYGHTGTVQQRTYTPAECDSMLRSDLGVAYGFVQRCIPGANVNQAAALTSAAFNIGPKVVCGSTLQRKAIAGDWRGACAQLDRWVLAGGRKVRGLIRRRAAERELCEKAP